MLFSVLFIHRAAAFVNLSDGYTLWYHRQSDKHFVWKIFSLCGILYDSYVSNVCLAKIEIEKQVKANTVKPCSAKLAVGYLDSVRM